MTATRVGGPALLEVARFEDGAPDALPDRARDLIAQAVRIDDSAAIKSLHHTCDADFSTARIDGNLGACRQVTALLESAGDAEPAFRRCRLLAPAEALGGRFKRRPQANVGEILQAKLQSIEIRELRQLIHLALASEVVGCRGKPAIRSLAQWWVFGWVKLNLLVGDSVGRINAGRTRIVVVEFPGDQGAVGSDAALDVDHAGGSEQTPGKTFFPRPNDS